MTMLAQRNLNPIQRAPAISFGTLQRKCACGQHTNGGGKCAGCQSAREKTLQRSGASHESADSFHSEVPPIVHEVLRSEGQPLDSATRAFMEPRFGHDFSQVRVHTDARAAESAQAVNALGYTVGRDVVLTSQQALGNKMLLAHELAHVIQQRNQAAPSLNRLGVGAFDSAESEAETAAQFALSGRRMPVLSQFAPVGRVQRVGMGDVRVAEAVGTSCGPDVTDWFVGIMNSAKSDSRVLDIQRRLSGATRLGARYGYSATNILEGAVVRKVLAAEAAAGHPARPPEAGRQIAAADPGNEFGRALLGATAPIPFVGAPEQIILGQIKNASLIWKSLVETGAVWDFKNNVLSGARLSGAGCPRTCPDPPTVTLCSTCFEHDLPGNLFYAYIGKVCGFSLNALQLGSQFAELLPTSSGGWDPPEDTAAINLGFGLPTTLTRTNLCSALSPAGSVTTRTCTVCPTTYSP
jgi:uncharacterized protein DUF4157/putative RNase toxin 44 of polymorphic toxin system